MTTMKNGIKTWVNGAIDTMDETAQRLIDGGVAPKEAVKAAALLTKTAVAESLEKNLGNLNAAEFTHGLRTQQESPLLN
ncbi:hypothetical protein CO611_06595 [Lysobacteraceae bacterium NML03-0222]|nr:hypothetical protein CO611_06595 [Xanthomonadaceae bacterium NML03-0222]